MAATMTAAPNALPLSHPPPPGRARSAVSGAMGIPGTPPQPPPPSRPTVLMPFHTRRAIIDVSQHGVSLDTGLRSSLMLASPFSDHVAHPGDRRFDDRPATVAVAQRPHDLLALGISARRRHDRQLRQR